MSNFLINEKSPYLSDHAENPVNWYPWCDEAFDKALNENKPIFLSIGYSTCHWCHVMAHEDFENEAVADILNRYYVSIKVDREERADIDSVYMAACTLLNGSGGWPLTVLMTPEQKPFFAGTYIPRENSGNRMGLISLLTVIASKWESDRAGLEKSADDICMYLSKDKPLSGAKADKKLLVDAAEQLLQSCDRQYGGFGTSPKFPTPQNLLFLMRYTAASGDRHYRQAVDDTLKAMYRGGIFDHVGGGFCRYSTDREWLAPHFEKTLYDNALLAYTYTEAWQNGHYALYRTAAESVLDYCLRELHDDAGGFFCGQDADSNGVEGAYYLFTPDEVNKVLGDIDGRHFCECYDITPEGNFNGKSIPNLLINTRWYLLPEGYDVFREKLRLYRDERMPLKTDCKKLLSWNGMMLMALAKAAAVFEDERCLAAAEELAVFIKDNFSDNGAYRSRLCLGELKYDALLADYAFYALGLIELYKADMRIEHISEAEKLAGLISSHFAAEAGFFYSTSDTAEKLILRPKEIYDSAAPSGCSAAVLVFDELWRYTCKPCFRTVRDRYLNYLASYTGKYAAGAPFALCALIGKEYPFSRILLVQDGNIKPEIIKILKQSYSANPAVLLKTQDNTDSISKAIPFTVGAAVKSGKLSVYSVDDDGLLHTAAEI